MISSTYQQTRHVVTASGQCILLGYIMTSTLQAGGATNNHLTIILDYIRFLICFICTLNTSFENAKHKTRRNFQQFHKILCIVNYML